MSAVLGTGFYNGAAVKMIRTDGVDDEGSVLCQTSEFGGVEVDNFNV